MKAWRKAAILNQLEGLAGDFATGGLTSGDSFEFRGIKITVLETTGNLASGSVSFKIDARNKFVDDIQQILSGIDLQLGDPITPVTFEDATPHTTRWTTDSFRADYSFTPTLSVDLINL